MTLKGLKKIFSYNKGIVHTAGFTGTLVVGVTSEILEK